MAMNIISVLLRNGFKPALISRGYKGKWEKRGGVLSNGIQQFGRWEESGDEPFMVSKSIPEAGVFIGKDRIASCKKAKQLGFDTAILDDCFQYRPLRKDVDILIFDPAERIALREPVSSLKRAHIILMKKDLKSNIKQKLRERFSHVSFFEYSVKPQGIFRLGEKEIITSEELNEKKTLAFCGIARPERFLSSLESENINPVLFLKFQDHHSYPRSSIKKIVDKYYMTKADVIITTEKDAVKIVSFEDIKNLPVYILKIDLDIEESFYEKIFFLLKEKNVISP